MNSLEIQQHIAEWAQNHNFSAPYGVLTGQHVNARGRKFLSVTFGRARTLDATVEIYNRNFLILRTSRSGSQIFDSINELQSQLNNL